MDNLKRPVLVILTDPWIKLYLDAAGYSADQILYRYQIQLQVVPQLNRQGIDWDLATLDRIMDDVMAQLRPAAEVAV